MDKMYKYPIKVVSQLTGLSVFVIRAWEKRYGVVVPSRTETNRRLYTDEDIEKLKLLNDAINNGYNIGGIAGLTISELKTILGSKTNISKAKNVESIELFSEDAKPFIDECLKAVKVYDSNALETILLKASSKLSRPQLIEDLIIPLVYNIGDLWHNGNIRIANEHLASSVIRAFLTNLVDQHSTSENAPVIISATPRGQDHELGALIVAVTAASEGWKVIYLGPNLPEEEIAAVSDALEAKAVALSIVYPSDDPQLRKDLINLRKMLPKNISLIVGGRAVEGYLETLNKINAIVVGNTKQLKVELNMIREHRLN
jgi:DNA-binding transcriptional MerR regulator/methylmalonyl-CoA mutase cobalamin-binding subunit